jgi:hypothetical protein
VRADVLERLQRAQVALAKTVGDFVRDGQSIVNLTTAMDAVNQACQQAQSSLGGTTGPTVQGQ